LYEKKLWAIIKIQSHVRKLIALRRYRKLKVWYQRVIFLACNHISPVLISKTNGKCPAIHLFLVLCKLQIAYPFQDKRYIIYNIQKKISNVRRIMILLFIAFFSFENQYQKRKKNIINSDIIFFFVIPNFLTYKEICH
jgi:hypothetical protein